MLLRLHLFCISCKNCALHYYVIITSCMRYCKELFFHLFLFLQNGFCWKDVAWSFGQFMYRHNVLLLWQMRESMWDRQTLHVLVLTMQKSLLVDLNKVVRYDIPASYRTKRHFWWSKTQCVDASIVNKLTFTDARYVSL